MRVSTLTFALTFLGVAMAQIGPCDNQSVHLEEGQIFCC